MDEHKNTTVPSKPFPASKSNSEEIMRQITECIAADLAEKYEQAENPKHCSPCFLVDTPGSNAKGLVVHYGKLNKLTKKHSGSLPSLEQALERAAHCRFKSELDKRSGFWQVELTKRVQDLWAFIAPNGQVFKLKVLPFGLTNAPATFQELMNQVVARMKLKPTVQALLKKGAFVEVYIDDVLLGTDDADDHLRLVEEFLRTCEECNTRVKLEKCEFMQEEIEYLGFQVGWRWWRPVKEKVAPILKASLRDDKTRGVKDIRAFLGSCDFHRRHIPTFTYSSHLFTDLTKKTVPWKWTPEHEAQFQEINEKLRSLRLLGTPAPDGEFVVITDASLVGGGGTPLQWQQIPGAATRRIADELKAVGVNRDGSLKHNYDLQKFHLVPIGHWNWKWSSTRANYSTYERELLSGILVISGQSRLFGSSSVVWLCDQESTETFLKGASLENRKLGRWWTPLAQLKLNIYRVRGLENELCDWLSREIFDEKSSARSEALSREAFRRMDVHLDLTMSKAELLSSLQKSDYVEEYGDILKALGDGSYALVDKELWSLSSSGILRKEVQTCIPKKALGAALQWIHDVVGHPGPDSWLWAFEKMFHTRVPDTELTHKIGDMHRTCKECVTSKRNRPSDRGLLGVLPLPHMVNALLYVDFIDRPECHNFDYALMIVDALSAFCQGCTIQEDY